MSEIKKIIQKNIAFYRKSAKLTQKELADRIHVPATSLATWEQGKSLPDIDTLFLLCSALNVDILTISGFQPPENQHHYGDGIESAMKDFNNALHAMQAHSAKIGSTLTLYNTQGFFAILTSKTHITIHFLKICNFFASIIFKQNALLVANRPISRKTKARLPAGFLYLPYVIFSVFRYASTGFSPAPYSINRAPLCAFLDTPNAP